MTSEDVDKLAKKLWDYHHLNHKLEKADCLFVLTSHDIRVAEYAAKLFFAKWAPFIIFSGGFSHPDDLLAVPWGIAEAEFFSKKAIEIGVPKDKIIVENKATNTGENVLFAKNLLEEKGTDPQKIIAVSKPYMERRVFATFKKFWPKKKLIVTSPPISYENYPNKEISKEVFINIMVGDFQRIKVYPEKGFQIFQKIPKDVWESYEKLVKLGYNKHLLK